MTSTSWSSGQEKIAPEECTVEEGLKKCLKSNILKQTDRQLELAVYKIWLHSGIYVYYVHVPCFKTKTLCVI